MDSAAARDFPTAGCHGELPTMSRARHKSRALAGVIPIIVCLLGCGARTLVPAAADGGGGIGGAGPSAGTAGNGNGGTGGIGGPEQSAGTGGHGNGGAGGMVSIPTARCPAGDTPYEGDPSGNLRFCGGLIPHRVSTNACPWVPSSAVLPATTFGDECVRGTDCVAQAYGQCFSTGFSEGDGVGGASGHKCLYGCVTDNDCGSGHACYCAGGWGSFCVTANCTTDADCASGELCTVVYPGATYMCKTRE